MIGRERESKDLNRLYDSGRAELVAIYGRRRVGKTFLVDETFAGRITFRHAGLSPADEEAKGLMQAQLNHFCRSGFTCESRLSVSQAAGSTSSGFT